MEFDITDIIKIIQQVSWSNMKDDDDYFNFGLKIACLSAITLFTKEWQDKEAAFSAHYEGEQSC